MGGPLWLSSPSIQFGKRWEKHRNTGKKAVQKRITVQPEGHLFVIQRGKCKPHLNGNQGQTSAVCIMLILYKTL